MQDDTLGVSQQRVTDTIIIMFPIIHIMYTTYLIMVAMAVAMAVAMVVVEEEEEEEEEAVVMEVSLA